MKITGVTNEGTYIFRYEYGDRIKMKNTHQNSYYKQNQMGYISAVDNVDNPAQVQIQLDGRDDFTYVRTSEIEIINFDEEKLIQDYHKRKLKKLIAGEIHEN